MGQTNPVPGRCSSTGPSDPTRWVRVLVLPRAVLAAMVLVPTLLATDASAQFAYQRVYSFHGYPFDGDRPAASLVQAPEPDGRFYGTTQFGGSDNLGTIFRVDSTGQLTILRSFDPNSPQQPEAALTLGADGNFYGTSSTAG